MGVFDELLVANGIRLTEGIYAYGSDPDYWDNAFWRLTKVKNDRDLQPVEQQRQTQIALFLYDANPLAERILDLVNSFVTGDGFTYMAKHERVQRVLDKFWTDPVNDWPLKQLDRFRQLSLLGEALWPCAVRRTDGRLRIGYVDPANIDEIIPDPYNPEIALTACIKAGYHLDAAGVAKRLGNTIQVVYKHYAHLLDQEADARADRFLDGALQAKCPREVTPFAQESTCPEHSSASPSTNQPQHYLAS